MRRKGSGLSCPARSALFLILCGLAFAGPVRAVDEVVREGDPLTFEPTSDRALVYILYAGLKGIDLFVDRTPIGTLNDTYVAVRVDPGPRVIWGALRGRRFDFEPGKTYVVTHFERWSVLGGKSLAEQVKARRLRWMPPSVEQSQILAKRLAAGEYAWAIEVLGMGSPQRLDDVLVTVEKGESSALAAEEEALFGAAFPIERAARLAGDLEVREEIPSQTAAAAPVSEIADGLLDLLAYFEEDADRVIKTLQASRVRVPIPLVPVASIGAVTLAVGPVLRLPGSGGSDRPALIEAPLVSPAAVSLARDSKLAELPGLARDLESHLAGEPDDVAARLLAVRLGRLEELGRSLPGEAPMVEWLQIETEARAHRARLQAHVDEVLKREPENVSAYLWKARLERLWLPVLRVDRIDWETPGLEAALGSARRAVELAPADPDAAQVLSELLFETGKLDEALAAARQGGEGSKPVAELLADLQAVTLPPGAVALPTESRRLARLLADRGWLGRFPELRVRSYAVPMSADAIGKFYQRQWPKHVFFTLGEEKLAGLEGRLLGQHLRWKPQGLEPTGNRDVLARHEEGLGLFLLELSNLPDAKTAAAMMPAAKALRGKMPGARLCIFSIVTFRPTPLE